MGWSSYLEDLIERANSEFSTVIDYFKNQVTLDENVRFISSEQIIKKNEECFDHIKSFYQKLINEIEEMLTNPNINLEICDLKKTNEILNENINTLNKTIETANQKIKTLELELKSRGKDYQTLIQRINNCSEEIHNGNRKIENLENEKAKLINENKITERVIDQKLQEISKLKEENVSLVDRLLTYTQVTPENLRKYKGEL